MSEHNMESIIIIKRLRYTWMAIGKDWPEQYKCFAVFYSKVIAFFAAIWFPLHLIIFLALSESPAEIFQNLIMTVAATSNSIKHFYFRFKRAQMRQLNDLFKELDKRVQHKDEVAYLQESIIKVSRRMLNAFAISYYSVTISNMVSLIMSGRRELVAPGWFPIDWNASIYHYIGAITLQYVSLVLATTMNLFNDCYGPLLLCTFAGHVHMLQMRIARIGHDLKITSAEHVQELKLCIKDYQLLMCAHKIIEETLSMALFTQFIASSVNICGAVVYIIFYSKNIFSTMFVLVHLLAIAVELLPACYYGSLLQLKFKELTFAIYCCNWLQQPRAFHQNMIILTELTMRDVTPYAGGMVRIHLDSYFATCKMAYSLVTLIMGMK